MDQTALVQKEIKKWLNKKEDFSSLSTSEKIKYMAYFYIQSRNKVHGNNNWSFTEDIIKGDFNIIDLPVPPSFSNSFQELVDSEIFVKKNNDSYRISTVPFDELIYEFKTYPAKVNVCYKLKNLISRIPDLNRKQYLEEALFCYKFKRYRAAIIMTWIATIDQLQELVLSKKLSEFNMGLKEKNWKVVVQTRSDFENLKEAKFIEVLRDINMVSKEDKKLLDQKLEIRNTCAHPNGQKISEVKATDFIEDLLNNIILKY